jgi:EAL domain-containing protein (putative c-di-GMP-specific phosphodiesterase class I)
VNDVTRRVLLAEDDASLRGILELLLRGHGYSVSSVGTGGLAKEEIEKGQYDVILTDINMPEISGVDLLKWVRKHDLDVPVILMTGTPSTESAVDAVNLGAFRYLLKPVEGKVILEHINRAVAISKFARVRRESLANTQSQPAVDSDNAGLHALLDRALATLRMVFQPIVKWSEKRVFGYEALARSGEPLMLDPVSIITTAERLHRLDDFGRKVRRLTGKSSNLFPKEALIFVNLHPNDLDDQDLYSNESPLSTFADRVVLEITERAHLESVSNASRDVEKLKDLGYRVALDDFGAGYSGLNTFAAMHPDIVKIDLALIRDVHKDETKQKLVHAVVELCKDLSLQVIAEGIESPLEHRTLIELGVDLFQGYLYGRPNDEPVSISFERLDVVVKEAIR